jgi:tRNA modification GTPase
MTPPISISVETGRGIDQLLTCLGELLPKLYAEMTVQEDAILTRERHRRSVQQARKEITAFVQCWREGEIPISIATIHLKSAEQALEEMMGSVDTEDVLDDLFRTFCVGK